MLLSLVQAQEVTINCSTIEDTQGICSLLGNSGAGLAVFIDSLSPVALLIIALALVFVAMAVGVAIAKVISKVANNLG